MVLNALGEHDAAVWLFGSCARGEARHAAVMRNRQLTELVRDVPLDVEIADLARQAWDRERVHALFDNLQFRVLRERLFATLTEAGTKHVAENRETWPDPFAADPGEHPGANLRVLLEELHVAARQVARNGTDAQRASGNRRFSAHQRCNPRCRAAVL